MSDSLSIEEVQNYTYDEIKHLVESNDLSLSSSRVIGVYFEGGAGTPHVGGEGLHFIGSNLETGEMIR